MSYDEALPCTDNRITDPNKPRGTTPLVSYDEPLTRTDNRIKELGLATPLNDTTILSSQGETLGELRRATDSDR